VAREVAASAGVPRSWTPASTRICGEPETRPPSWSAPPLSSPPGSAESSRPVRPVGPVTVRVLAEGVGVPLDVMAGPGAPSVAELSSLGVARIGVGAGIAQAAHTLVRRAARELLGTGTYESPAGGLDCGELNTLPGQGR